MTDRSATCAATDSPMGDLEAEATRAAARALFPRLDWHELWADDEETEWLHEPLLAARRSVVVYSPAKVGKSLLLLDLAVHLSRGTAFLGHRTDRRIRVLYIDFENDPRGDVRSRLQAMGYSPDDLDHLDYLSFPTMAGLDTAQGAAELLAAVDAYGSEVVVIDTISRAVNGEENSNDTWNGLYKHTGLALKRAGVAIIRLDHTGKDESKGQRGGSAKSGDVDAVWRLTKVTDDSLRLECTDARMQIPVRSLLVLRQASPKLRHVLEASAGMTTAERKVADFVKLLNDNHYPGDAGRPVVRDFLKSRGFSASNDVLSEVVKARKAGSGSGAVRAVADSPISGLSAGLADSDGQPDRSSIFAQVNTVGSCP